jgi:hypothetical protein
MIEIERLRIVGESPPSRNVTRGKASLELTPCQSGSPLAAAPLER